MPQTSFLRNRAVAALLALTASIGSQATPGRADIAVDTLPGAFDGFVPNAGTTLGWAFTTSEVIRVTHLGLYDQFGNGFQIEHPVGLWDERGVLLAEIVLGPGPDGVLLDMFRYLELDPTIGPGAPILVPGVTYTIGFFSGEFATQDGLVFSDGDFTINPVIEYGGQGLATAGDSLQMPSEPAKCCHFFGPNFQFTVVKSGPGGALDARPGSCPNPLDRNGHGMLPVALVGGAAFDVTDVDRDSILLARADGIGGAVPPHAGPSGPHSVVEDVATGFDAEPCGCHALGGDGTDDLSMKFVVPELVETLHLGNLPAGAEIELVLTGTLFDGTPFEATDCIELVPAHGTGTTAPSVAFGTADLDGDGCVGEADLRMLLEAWQRGASGPADLDGDGFVSVSDLLALLAGWGPCL